MPKGVIAWGKPCLLPFALEPYSALSGPDMGRRIIQHLILSCLATSLAVSGVLAEQKAPSRLVVPSDQALAIMIKTILIAYNDANLTGNYTVLRDLASPSFRETNSSARLADIFRDMRQNNIDIAPIVLFQPKLVRKPQIDADGDLVLEGFFDTRPERVQFLIVYRAVEGLWKLFAIRVTTKPAQAAVAADRAPLPAAKPVAPESTLEKPKHGASIGGDK